jgi:signal transduction histidine kinase
MRRLLGVLRDDQGAALAPQPGFDSLADLVAGVRASGLAVEVVIDTDDGLPDDRAALASDVAQGLQLAVYRIVQEGLTNVLKHAGPAASARVVIARERDAVVVEIVDDGLGPRTSPDGDGHGLIGMRERAALFGGQVRATGRPDGGFAVHARLPVPASERDLAVDARR